MLLLIFLIGEVSYMTAVF